MLMANTWKNLWNLLTFIVVSKRFTYFLNLAFVTCMCVCVLGMQHFYIIVILFSKSFVTRYVSHSIVFTTKSTNKYNKLIIVIPDKMLLKNTLVLVTIIFGNHFCLAASKTKVFYIFVCKVFIIDQSCKTSSGKYNIDGHLNSMYICYGNTRVDNALADAGLNMFFFFLFKPDRDN